VTGMHTAVCGRLLCRGQTGSLLQAEQPIVVILELVFVHRDFVSVRSAEVVNQVFHDEVEPTHDAIVHLLEFGIEAILHLLEFGIEAVLRLLELRFQVALQPRFQPRFEFLKIFLRGRRITTLGHAMEG
jgi:hypothetical protein